VCYFLNNLKIMTTRLAQRILLSLLTFNLALSLCAAQSTTGDQPVAAPASEKPAKAFHPVTPGPTDGPIACLTARMLEELHYLKQPFDHSVSSKFLDRYMESFDPQHVHFTQADRAQFEHYRETLGDLTITPRGVADTRPACEIFNRFMERLQQRVAYADELLKNEKFTFDGDERILVNRKDQPYPKDLTEAKQLWRERLRFEYLQEHMGKIDAKKKPDASKKVDAKPKSESQEIAETLTRRYHRNLRIFTDWDNEDVLQVYLTALAHVYDPHSDYYGHAQLEGFAIGMNLSLSGIGAELTTTEDGYCSIRRLLPEGPAEKSKKIKPDDRIIAVAQGDQPPVDVVEMRLDKAVQLIRGPKGTEVRLTIVPKDESTASSKVVTLIRDDIKLEDQAAKAKIIDLPNGDQGNMRLGVIDLPSFYAPFDVGTAGSAGPKSSTSADVAKLLKKLKEEKVGGVILDLRRNGGGSLEEAIKLTGLFIKQGPVVQVRDSNGTVQEDADRDPSVAYDGPLIVLTSRFSASASEIVAGALQDYGRALLVGDSSTHGKGTVQSVNNLRPYLKLPGNLLTNDPGALKLTIKKFYRASGASTQKEGVVPDIVLPSMLNESKDIGEASLENPLPWDTIPTAKYDHLNRVEPYLAELRKRSAQRVNTEKDFAYIREDIEQMKKAQADKSVSLNEKQRLKEKEEADARQKARDKERLARKEPDEKVYELTLRQVDLPGLPPPVAKTNSALAKLSRLKGVTGGVSTNSASAQGSSPTVAAGEIEEPDDLKPDGVDVSMIEAEHILVDYLSVLPKQDVVTTSRRVN
jgi:carboxyl-terminal processing protease